MFCLAIWNLGPALAGAALGELRLTDYDGVLRPLRDHFHPPLDKRRSWDELHGSWPAIVVIGLNRRLPRRYAAAPGVHRGGSFKVDVTTCEEDEANTTGTGGLATAVWAPPRPTLTVATDLLDLDEYEIRVYDTKHDRRLVAVVEIVSPANKDRPEHRRAFVAKCAALLQNRVSVAIVDVVTTRGFNLYADLIELCGQTDPSLSLAGGPPPVYAAACRAVRREDAWLLETWTHPLNLGQPLPTLPLWLADNLAVPLELELSDEERPPSSIGPGNWNKPSSFLDSLESGRLLHFRSNSSWIWTFVKLR
jgi:Protein of unknown function (DUF4058)